MSSFASVSFGRQFGRQVVGHLEYVARVSLHIRRLVQATLHKDHAPERARHDSTPVHISVHITVVAETAAGVENLRTADTTLL